MRWHVDAVISHWLRCSTVIARAARASLSGDISSKVDVQPGCRMLRGTAVMRRMSCGPHVDA
ncbi:hypothetical protein B9J09_02130 [Xylella fastidiosa subsp. pauca]|uniref:Uncharacterized protein n=1 Tax=Xylella fastidiosa (strain 9a5c) TaxID=160492 RepID=Q9PFW6_XYLFA|nr:hypothetical protein XF_0541 [Xylella fastidiosa 9a5c]ARO68021.1 hypothetical protein B9J09_02130 [Xylella fastidiosa subsp. pauca]TNW22827.1 hypothetical protein EIP73_07960 [Xylella fastidiosa subsp. pauca]TNW26820.1 hypothetical protein EIP74_11580 [Xylella fastidiosa subsp. pauca]